MKLRIDSMVIEGILHAIPYDAGGHSACFYVSIDRVRMYARIF
jgi:hypothetical protein